MSEFLENDPYGIEKEELIKKSGIRDIFTPNQPINSIDLFMGRTKVVKSVIEGLNTPGQHLLLYGDRGVGKSSLANITVKILKNSEMINGKLIIKRCSSQDTFVSIANELLSKYKYETNLSEETVVSEHQEKANAKLLGLGAELGNKTQSSKKYKFDEEITPSKLSEFIKDKEGLYLIDEFDIIKDDKDKHNIAELIKLLSDYQSAFKIFIVGIAQSGSELTVGHPSISRCLREIKLERMEDSLQWLSTLCTFDWIKVCRRCYYFENKKNK